MKAQRYASRKRMSARQANRIREEYASGVLITHLRDKYHRSYETIKNLVKDLEPANNKAKPLTENQRKIAEANQVLMHGAVPIQEMVSGFVKQVRGAHPEVGEINVTIKLVQEQHFKG